MSQNATLQTPSAGLCPICGQPNLCAMEAARITGIMSEPCWCSKVAFSKSVLDRIPAEATNTACVCESCRAATPA